MTENAVTTYTSMTKEELKALTGQFVGGSESFLSRIFINKLPEDKDGKEVPVGTFVLRVGDKDVYAKRKSKFLFRPYLHRNRYTKFDEVTKKTASRTIFFNDWKQEAISDDGLIRCGKAGKEDRSVKCKHVFFGTATFKGVTSDGTEVDVKDHPCSFMVGGKNFLEISKLVDTVKGILFDFEMVLQAKPNELGNYSIDLKWDDLTKASTPPESVWGANMNLFITNVETENKIIRTKYEQAIRNKQTPVERDDKTVEIPNDLSADFDEDVDTGAE